MRDKPCEPVVLMLLGLLGYPGFFRQLARLKKNCWMYMDGSLFRRCGWNTGTVCSGF